VVGVLAGLLFAILLAEAVEIASAVAMVVLLAGAIAAGVAIASIVSAIARRSSGSSRSVSAAVTLAATGGFACRQDLAVGFDPRGERHIPFGCLRVGRMNGSAPGPDQGLLPHLPATQPSRRWA
jgi:hypothetical protein